MNPYSDQKTVTESVYHLRKIKYLPLLGGSQSELPLDILSPGRGTLDMDVPLGQGLLSKHGAMMKEITSSIYW